MTNASLPPSSLDRELAERVHAACLQTLIAAYDQAAGDGLCAEGAWEVALEQLRAMDLDSLLQQLARSVPLEGG